MVEAHAGVEGHHSGRGLFIIGAETVLAAVGRAEARMRLEDEVGLTGDPEARVLDVREQGFRIVAGRQIGKTRPDNDFLRGGLRGRGGLLLGGGWDNSHKKRANDQERSPADCELYSKSHVTVCPAVQRD